MGEFGGGGGQAHPNQACRRFDLQLQDYLEGQDRPEVTAHAADCPYCGALLADLLLLRATAGEMGSEEPPARLWANVRASLVQEGLIRPSRRRHPGLLDWFLRPIPAAGFAALLLTGFLSLRSLGYLHTHQTHASVMATARVDSQLESNVAEMESTFRVRSTSLDPGVRAAYEQGLSALDSEIQECRDSLSKQPNDGLAREYLNSAYTEKAHILASALEAGDGF